MSIHTRESFPALLKESTHAPAQCYLLFGERYLCRDAAKKLTEHLLHATPGTMHAIDGDREDITTLVYKLRSFSLLPGRQVYKVTDTRLFLSKNVANNIWKKALQAHQAGKSELVVRHLRGLLNAGGIGPQDQESNLQGLTPKQWQHHFGFNKPDEDLSWTAEPLATIGEKASATLSDASDGPALLMDCLEEGIPGTNILVLLADEVDKRKKLFQYFKKNHAVIDLSVETGASAKAKKHQKDVLLSLIRQTLAEMNKTLSPGVAERLIDRVGFHPVAVVTELRKVMLYCGDRQDITQEDLDAVVGRTRQEAIFELTSALSEKNLQRVLVVADRLQANGFHPLALIAALRNSIRSLLLFRALQEQRRFHYSPSLSAAVFQQQCLPRLKEHSRWKKELSGHPFALFMQFKTAASHSLPQLQHWLSLLLEAELRLKGSPLSSQIVLEHLFLSMLSGRSG